MGDGDGRVVCYESLAEVGVSAPQVLRLVDIVPVLAAAAARALGCSDDAVLGQSRAKTPTLARHCAMAAARRWTRPGSTTPAFSLTDVGHAFGGRNHTTVLYAERETAKRERDDPAIAELLGALADALETAARGGCVDVAVVESSLSTDRRVAGLEARLALAEDRLGETRAQLQAAVRERAAAVHRADRVFVASAEVGADLLAAQTRVAELERARGDVAREVRLARIAGVAEGASRAKTRHPRQTRSRRPAARLLSELVGRYTTAVGDRRRLVFVQTSTEWLLLDRGEDERVVERFSRTTGLLEVSAVATTYLEQVRSVGAPCATEILS